MPRVLRGYQVSLKNRSIQAWNRGSKVVMPVTATGSGKTEVMSSTAETFQNEAQVGIAHRSVLIGQMSKAFASRGIVHDIIADKSVVRTIVNEHMDEYKRNFYNPSSQIKIASVDTLPGRMDQLQSWIRKVTLGFNDEGHHVLFDNKWGKAIRTFPGARFMLPTATPERADGQGLGINASGLVDEIIEGPAMRWLIDNGYLCDYTKGFCSPLPADLDLSNVDIGDNGEYNQAQLRRAVHKSGKIIGNIVDTYIERTMGKLGIVFAVDIEHAQKITDEFNRKGVTCELITSNHSEEQRRDILKRYRNKETLVLVNVDLFGEGFDLPAIEVVMFGRPTASYALFAQQFGRALRLMISPIYMAAWEDYTPAQRLTIIAHSAKPFAHIHDHVGNTIHFFGPPDKPRIWTLEDTRGRRGVSDAIPLRRCLNTKCMQVFERFYTECPFCKTAVPPPAGASLPEHVDGDILLYTPEMLRKLFGVESAQAALTIKMDESWCPIPPHLNKGAKIAIQERFHNKVHAQRKLASLMPLVMPPSLSPREAAKRFFLRYGVDIVQAKLLDGAATEELNSRIEAHLMGGLKR